MGEPVLLLCCDQKHQEHVGAFIESMPALKIQPKIAEKEKDCAQLFQQLRKLPGHLLEVLKKCTDEASGANISGNEGPRVGRCFLIIFVLWFLVFGCAKYYNTSTWDEYKEQETEEQNKVEHLTDTDKKSVFQNGKTGTAYELPIKTSRHIYWLC